MHTRFQKEFGLNRLIGRIALRNFVIYSANRFPQGALPSVPLKQARLAQGPLGWVHRLPPVDRCQPHPRL